MTDSAAREKRGVKLLTFRVDSLLLILRTENQTGNWTALNEERYFHKLKVVVVGSFCPFCLL